MSQQQRAQTDIEREIKETKLKIAEVQIFKAQERLQLAIQRHEKLSGGHGDLKIMTDTELSLVRARLAANPDIMIDPAVAKRLLFTAEYYRDAISMASPYLHWSIAAGQQSL